MSFDLNLPTVCNHRIYKELTTLEADRRSIMVSKPIGSSNSVGLFASGNFVPNTEYEVVFDPNTLDVNKPKMIQFKSKWRSIEDYFEVNYVTLSSFCPKCIGLNVLDDISLDVRGNLVRARDEKLLLQNLEKFVVTELKSNPFHSFLGTSLVSLLGEKIRDSNLMAARVSEEINTSIEKLRDLQEQYKATGRALTDGEQVGSVDFIEVLPDEDDPTILRASVEVTALSGKTVELNQVLKIVEG